MVNERSSLEQQQQHALKATSTGLTDASSITDTRSFLDHSTCSSRQSHDDQGTVIAQEEDRTRSPPPNTSSYANRAALQEQWWQRTIVRRSLSAVRESQAQVERESLFLQQQQPQQRTALFARSEIQTGRLLGKGGFSLVYAIDAFRLDPTVSARCTVEQRRLRQQCVEHYTPETLCLKHLNASLVRKSPKDFSCALSDLATEAAYLARLDHPFILPLRGLPLDGLSALRNGQHDSYFIITERLVDTLDQWIQQGNKTKKNSTTVNSTPEQQEELLSEKLTYALQLAEALQYLHQHRIAFRDLKPQNIGFAMNDHRIQLFDFGLCRELPNNETDDDAVFQMSGVGTRRYMAPEIIVGEGRYNLKADVYSWAVVTWELLSGHKPYAHYSATDHCALVCQGGERPPLRSEWPEHVQYILVNAWCENVRERWTVARVVQQVTRVLSTYDETRPIPRVQQKQQATTPKQKRIIKPLPNHSPTGIIDYVDVDMVESSPSHSSWSERVDEVLNMPILPSATSCESAAAASSVLPFRRCVSLEPRRPSQLAFRLDPERRDVMSAPTSPVVLQHVLMPECDGGDDDEEVSSLRLNKLDQELTIWCPGGVEVVCSDLLQLPMLCSFSNCVEC